MTEPSRPSRRFALLVALGALSAFGPLSMDLYLPSLPSLSRALGTTDSLAQASVSTALLGLALGQLLAGPASDRLGRRTPVLAGVSLFVVASVLCALAPNIWVFLVLRLLQGLGGAAGLAGLSG
ncbi:MFS transporter [Gryllotalpicola ginsengisoli]|uniref:MFS transporter n=1 Tax=Gryllotalpicola ginsengisoli TaxID=444608 RepID=UPI0003B31F76|nr:MFS transporter [Gryllotalpicola ginsengisoli]